MDKHLPRCPCIFLTSAQAYEAEISCCCGYISQTLADMLAKVLVLPPVSVGITDEFGKQLASTSVPGSISRTDVLALFGSSDD